MRIKKDKVYKVEWEDITGHNHESIKENNLTKCWTIGYLKENKKEYIVIYGKTEDGDYCFDAIPKSVVINIKEIA